MKISELKAVLERNAGLNVRFVLPDGSAVAPHAHVTEVARVDKRYVDCGGTLRNDSLCRLQTWVSDDFNHRLAAGKLFKILDKSKSILMFDDLETDVEHEHAPGIVCTFPLTSAEADGSEILLRLTERHTACLAEDKCKVK